MLAALRAEFEKTTGTSGSSVSFLVDGSPETLDDDVKIGDIFPDPPAVLNVVYGAHLKSQAPEKIEESSSSASSERPEMIQRIEHPKMLRREQCPMGHVLTMNFFRGPLDMCMICGYGLADWHCKCPWRVCNPCRQMELPDTSEEDRSFAYALLCAGVNYFVSCVSRMGHTTEPKSGWEFCPFGHRLVKINPSRRFGFACQACKRHYQSYVQVWGCRCYFQVCHDCHTAAPAPKIDPHKVGWEHCPMGHDLTFFWNTQRNHQCDYCKARDSNGAVLFGCQQCGYDICEWCRKEIILKALDANAKASNASRCTCS